VDELQELLEDKLAQLDVMSEEPVRTSDALPADFQPVEEQGFQGNNE
jgi:hypothetical protein